MEEELDTKFFEIKEKYSQQMSATQFVCKKEDVGKKKLTNMLFLAKLC